jgi:hypothetical protein
MRRKPDDPKQPEDIAKEVDTASFEHQEGATEGESQPERRLPRMPHERDQSVRGTGSRLDETPPPSEAEIRQAVDDIESGRIDTDRRGIPDDVPGSKRNREP